MSMFKSLSERLSKTLDALRGSGRMTEQNIRDALRDVRMALLEADVALPVVQAFTDVRPGAGARHRSQRQPHARARPSSRSSTRSC